ncbi:retinoschisin-like [Branchiostoma lanceolatum]|uniref:retinoschisin-like n=1 Tax=Branchiostoma lanceolatum TaxID=7740 RepID=UPI003451D294
MESGAIPDDSITTSSFQGPDYEPYRGRLNGVAGEGAWVSGDSTIGQWFQVYFGKMKRVMGTIIQGRHSDDQWVTSYKLQYSIDQITWTTYAGNDGLEMVFPGNVDRCLPVTNLLNNSVDARYVRFVVQSWHGLRIGMRAEIVGCNTSLCVDPPTQANTTGPVCKFADYPGENCTYPCSPGYYVISGDVITRTCTENGTWTEPDVFCQDCSDPLGVESGAIPDDSITASSIYSHEYDPYLGRLNRVGGAWAAKYNTIGQWLQVGILQGPFGATAEL